MNAYRKKYLGITLLELMLVLAIASLFIVMGYNQYASYKRDTDLRAILLNVDAISQAAARFYYANCGNQQMYTTFLPGRLSPLNSSPPSNPYPINVALDLVAPGYLTLPIAPNPLVKNIGPGHGYTVQFNQKISDRMTTTCADPPDCTTTQQVKIGTNVDWQIQIGVILNNASMGKQYAAYLQATCLSTLNTGTNTTVACSNVANFNSLCLFLRSMPANQLAVLLANMYGCPPNANLNNYNNYMVFIRSPSFPAIHPQEGLWGSKSSVYLFKQNFEVAPITTLTTTSHSPEYQYFLCGS